MTAPDACETCGRKRPLELQMTTKSGTELTMRSCPRCETRSWQADGKPVAQSELLRLTSENPEFELVPHSGRPRRAGRG